MNSSRWFFSVGAFLVGYLVAFAVHAPMVGGATDLRSTYFFEIDDGALDELIIRSFQYQGKAITTGRLIGSTKIGYSVSDGECFENLQVEEFIEELVAPSGVVCSMVRWPR